jgi:hypothetical protein
LHDGARGDEQLSDERWWSTSVNAEVPLHEVTMSLAVASRTKPRSSSTSANDRRRGASTSASALASLASQPGSVTSSSSVILDIVTITRRY